MKSIRIVCVGKVKERYFLDGIEDALKTIRKKYQISVLECADEATPDGASKAEENLIKDKEGQRILSRLDGEDYVVALCIEGKHYSSADWYRHLDNVAGQISGSLVFVIGGSLGLSGQVLKRADEYLSFSAMTFPHQMMRLILLKQIASWTAGDSRHSG